MDPHGGDGSANHPAPTIWPVGFAVGIACIFVGLILSTVVLAVGAVLAALFGFLWIRDVTSGYRAGPEPAPAPPPVPAHKAEPALSELREDEVIRYPR